MYQIARDFGNAEVFVGARSAERLYYLDECRRIAEVHVATDDGSAGYHGVVVSCGGDAAENFGGSVFRIDCMGSLAFGLEERESSVVAFDTAGGVYCIVATRRR